MAQKIDFNAAPIEQIEAELGQRFESIRLAHNINQTQLAERAGVSRRTITRLENGHGVSVDTLVRVMQAFGLAERLATLLPDADIRPIDRVRFKGKERRRARTRRTSAPAEWHWGDGSDDA